DIDAKVFTVKEKPQFTFSRSGSSAELSIRPHRGEIGFVGSGRQRTWRVLFSKDIAWDLDIRTGAATGNLDLRDLRVGDLNLRGGVGDVSVRFGDKANSTTADINAGVSDIKLMVPKNVGVRLKMNSGISSTDFKNIDLRRPRGASAYETPDFSHAAKKIMLYVNIGVSSLKVQGY
ncbi:MAG: LiaF domain-containing protein, partial [Candidatus Aquicultor sp.]